MISKARFWAAAAGKVSDPSSLKLDYTILADGVVSPGWAVTTGLLYNLLAAAQRKVPRIVFNYGTGTITVARAGSDTINGQTSWPIYPGQAWAFVDSVADRWDAF